jgi:hypothetical protein
LINPGLPIQEVRASENRLNITVSPQVPGKEYLLEGILSDMHGNTTNIIIDFYGHNPDIPSLLINEFITKGSETHPDLAEIKVTQGGNMAGVAVYAGVRNNWESRIVFPSFYVNSGELILVHFKPQGIAGEVDETGLKNQSLGLDASPDAYDFWIPGGKGLSGNNGVISVYSSPSGAIIDGVIYSNRSQTSDTLYSGFGSEKMMRKALELFQQGGWKASGDNLIPEDGINPDRSTSTRSICRDRVGTDIGTKSDWHIVPTRKSSFGNENSEEVYTGK